MKNKKIDLVLLMDFYSNLLSERRKIMMSDFSEKDLSISEIAQKYNVSRQAVLDTLKNAEKQLVDLEEKLGLVKKFISIKNLIENVCSQLTGKEKSKIKDIIDML